MSSGAFLSTLSQLLQLKNVLYPRPDRETLAVGEDGEGNSEREVSPRLVMQVSFTSAVKQHNEPRGYWNLLHRYVIYIHNSKSEKITSIFQ